MEMLKQEKLADKKMEKNSTVEKEWELGNFMEPVRQAAQDRTKWRRCI